MIDLIFYPAIAGMLLAIVGGPLGSFVIWQRMAYFGESIAHSALLGVALAIFFNMNMTASILIVCIGIAFAMNHFHKTLRLSLNTVLAITAHTSLAAGLVIISLIPGFRLDINSFLFGDLLAVSQEQFFVIAAIAAIILIFLLLYWQKLIALVANEELAFVEGIPTQRLQLLLMLMMAVLVAVGIKAVGVLLIVSLLVIPAATSRKWVNSPEAMAILASLLGLAAVMTGLYVSYIADTPVGPSIVTIAGLLYFCSQILLTTRKAR